MLSNTLCSLSFFTVGVSESRHCFASSDSAPIIQQTPKTTYLQYFSVNIHRGNSSGLHMSPHMSLRPVQRQNLGRLLSDERNMHPSMPGASITMLSKGSES